MVNDVIEQEAEMHRKLSKETNGQESADHSEIADYLYGIVFETCLVNGHPIRNEGAM